MTFARDSWTAYAQREGLLLDVGSRGVARPTNKYHAVRVQVDGHWFASKKEAARYQTLKLLQVTKRLDQLELQPTFPLHILEIWRSGVPLKVTTIGTYHADFRYRDLTTGEIVVEDVKSPATKTEAYQLRKWIAEAVHGITVQEV